MKRLQLSAPALLLAACATTGQTPLLSEFDLTGDPLPPVRHVTEMKVSGDTLFFVHDSEESHGQLFLRRAVIDLADNHLDISPEIGKKMTAITCHICPILLSALPPAFMS